MLRYVYDGTFIGFLTCVFESYRLHSDPLDICAASRLEPVLFAEDIVIPTGNYFFTVPKIINKFIKLQFIDFPINSIVHFKTIFLGLIKKMEGE